MRLEFEPNVTTLPFVETESFDEISISADFQSLLKSGITAAQSGDRDQARVLLMKAAAYEPQCEDAWMWLASISEYPEELLAFLNNVLNINPENERALEWRKATKALLAKSLVQRGVSAHKEGNDSLAAQCFEQAIVHDKECEMAWFWKASLTSIHDKRAELLDRVLEINPENQEAKNALDAIAKARLQESIDAARTAADSGEVSSVIELLGQVLADSPENIDAWTLKAHVSPEVHDKLAAFAKVLEIDPENQEAKDAVTEIEKSRLESLVTDAKAAAVSGDVPLAIELLDRALAASPDNADAWMLMSHLASGMQDKLDALAKVLLIDPANSVARSSYDFLASTTQPKPPVKEAEPDAVADEPDTVEAASDDETETEDLAFATATTDDAVDLSEETVDEPELAETGYAYTQTVTFNAAVIEEPVDKDEAVAEAFASATSQDLEAAAPADEVHITEEPVEAPPPVEQIFGPGENVADADGETVENHSPWDEYAEPTTDYSNGDAHPVEETPFELEVPDKSVAPNVDEMSAAAHLTGIACPFCSVNNEPQAFECSVCHATLSLSDIESLLANQRANREVIQRAVTQMEGEWNLREFDEKEMTELAIGHFNLQNFEPAMKYLQEASRLNPNNVILAGQLNTVAIRLEEIRRQDEAREAMPKGKTILVVDDSPTVRKLISGKLEKAGHSVVCAVDGVDALAKLEEQLPDLVLLDITMPRMDGYEVCKQIRSDPAARDLPVVMISGKDGFFDKVRGRMAGTSGYITKPFGPETLMKAIDTYLADEDGPDE